MVATNNSPNSAGLDSNADLQTVLAAWHTATVRLEQTHTALREEVQRLTTELEIKNRELARKNRLADLGQIATHVAHEVRNNLAPVTLYLSLLRRRAQDDAGSVDIVDKIETSITALEAMVNDLLHFTADRDPSRTNFEVDRLTNEIVHSLEPQLRAQSIDVIVDVPPHEQLFADENMIRRAVLNLILNAIDAMPDGGELIITSYQQLGSFELEIADSGAGLSDEVQNRAFDPFYSTKSTGTGLGLVVVERVASAHGGCVTARNCPEGGAAFTINIPQWVAEAAA